MIKLTGFGDEISSELEEQLDVLAAEGIRYLELRGVEGKNVVELEKADLDHIGEALERKDFRVSAIGSPIGKVDIREDLGPQLEGLTKAIQVAQHFETPYIRVFSFFLPPGEPSERYQDEVLRRMEAMAKLVEGEGVVLLHENEKDIYGDTAERCLEILSTVESPYLRAIFDFANFAKVGQRASTVWPLLRSYVVHFHIKDARMGGGIVPAGEGDSGMAQVLQEVVAAGFDGFMVLEPELHLSGRYGGFSGPEKFRIAVRAFKRLLEQENIPYEEADR